MGEQEPVRYDYMLFYAKKDQDEITALCLALEEKGFKGCLYDQDFGSQLENVPDLIQRSRWILFYVTKNFLPEETLFMHRDETLMMTLKENRLRVIPIYSPSMDSLEKLTSLDYGSLSPFLLIEGVNMHSDFAIMRLVEGLKRNPHNF